MKLSPNFEQQNREALARAFRAADTRQIYEWAADNVTVGSWSPFLGKMSFDHTPWLIEPLRALRRATDRKSTRLNSSHVSESRMPSSA